MVLNLKVCKEKRGIDENICISNEIKIELKLGINTELVDLSIRVESGISARSVEQSGSDACVSRAGLHERSVECDENNDGSVARAVVVSLAHRTLQDKRRLRSGAHGQARESGHATTKHTH